MTGPAASSDPPEPFPVVPRAFAAGKWAFASEWVSRLAQPLVLLVLARLLTPDDFGVATVATIIVGFAQVFWDSGLAKALVQREGTPAELTERANTVFWTNSVLSVVLYAGVWLAAAPIAVMFDDERVVDLVRVQGLAIPLLALSSVPTALFQRELRYRPVFVARLGAALAPGFVGLPLAILGGGYWALVAGAIAGAAIQSLLLFRMSPWKPRWTWLTAPLRQLTRFSAWSAGEAMLSWGILWLDAAIVGIFLSSHELGLYRTGNMAVAMAFGLTIGSVMPVLFAAFSRLQSAPVQLKAAFADAVKGVALVALGLTSVAVAVPGELSELVFGEQWREMEVAVFYLALTHAVSWLAAPNAELYRSMGRPDLNFKVIAVCLTFYAPVFVYAAQFGFARFLQARLAVGLAAFAIHLGVAWHCAGFSPARFARCAGWLVMAGAVSATVGLAVNRSLEATLVVRTVAVIAACGATYALLCVPERRFVIAIVRHWRQKEPADDARR